MITKPFGKLFTTIMLLCSLLLLLAIGAGCNDGNNPNLNEDKLKSNGDIQEGFPISITDSLDRELVFETRPERIISLSPATTEILFTIGAGDKIVGVTDYCDYPQEALKKPKVGGFENPNLELIISSKPDVIFTAAGIQQDFAKQWEDLGIKVVTLDAVNVNQVLDNIMLAGQVTGQSKKAQQVVTDLEQRIQRINAIVEKRVKNKPQVFFEIWDDPLMTAGPGSFIDDLINMAGGINIAGDAPKRFVDYNREVLISKNPDIYIIISHSHNPEDIKKRPGFEGLNAVQNNRVYTIKEDLVNRPAPRLVDGLEEIARIMHPEIF